MAEESTICKSYLKLKNLIFIVQMGMRTLRYAQNVSLKSNEEILDFTKRK